MVRAMALDAGKHRVRMNAVNPGFTDAGMTKDVQTPKQVIPFSGVLPSSASVNRTT
jgi:meso-butanediol dehydrogenase/(S,S)-butanediol dehydrogenase/diacetyl reductase